MEYYRIIDVEGIDSCPMYSKPKRKKVYTSSIGLALFLFAGMLASCKKGGDEAAPPEWFRKSRYLYDVETDTSSLQGRILLNVYNSSSNGRETIFFEEIFNDTGAKKYSNVMSMSLSDRIRKSDGLYSTASNDCSFGGGILGNVFDYKVIPASTIDGEVIPQYGCEHSDEGKNLVLKADTVITVPAGNYHAFYLQQANGDRSYWNREVGIILYEQYQNDRAFPYVKLATLKLRKIE